MGHSRRSRGLVVVLGLAGLLAVGVLGSSCDVSPPAATVNGATITQSQLNTRLEAIIQGYPDGVPGLYVRCALELQGSLPSSLDGAGGDTVSTQLASYELSTMILTDLIAQDLARRHDYLTASETSAARQDLEAQLQPSASGGTSPCGVTGRQLLERVPASFATSEVHFLALEEELAIAIGHLNLSTTALTTYYKQHSSSFAEVCLSDIEVLSQSEAQSIRSSIESGSTSFGDAARQNSMDTQTAANGGAYPCFLLSSLQNPPIVAALAPLAPGQVSQPVPVTGSSGQTAWFLLQLNGRPELPFSSAVTQIRETLLSGQGSKVTRELEHITTLAAVNVDPRYGTWSHLRGVSPPVPPPSKYVLAPGVNVPPNISSSAGS